MHAVEAILDARYPRPNNEAFDALFSDFENSFDATRRLLGALCVRMANPCEWAGYEVPDDVVALAEANKALALEQVQTFETQADIGKTAVQQFFLKNHCTFKYAMRKWLLLNPGIAIEPLTIGSDILEPEVISSAAQVGVKESDNVLHLHIVSNEERRALASTGFRVAHSHWDRSYFINALHAVDDMLQSNPESAGLFCEYSWAFAPDLHRLASDGRPYASFSFLKDKTLVGNRFYVGDALPNKYAAQYHFALRNERRRLLYEVGEFRPEAWGFFYPTDLLHDNILSLRSGAAYEHPHQPSTNGS